LNHCVVRKSVGNALLLVPTQLHVAHIKNSQFTTLVAAHQAEVQTLSLLLPHIKFFVTVWDLRVTLDQELTFSPHVQHLCCRCYHQLRQLDTISLSLIP